MRRLCMWSDEKRERKQESHEAKQVSKRSRKAPL
jgi:hypothetical protein